MILGWCMIAGLTLYPTPDAAAANNAISMWCLVCGELGVVDVTLNCLLFVPLGLGIGIRGVSRWRALILIVATTLTVELLQLKLIIGRDASLSDVLTNTAGGLLGYFLAGWWRRILLPRPRTALVFAIAGSAAWLGIQSVTGWAFSRSMPRSEYYGQWAPELGHLERFTGSVQSVELNGRTLPGFRLKSSEAVRRDLLGPRGVLDVIATTGDSTAGLAPIFSIFDDQQREILILGQDGTDLVFRIRTRSSSLKLRGPSLNIPDALPGKPGVPFTAKAEFGTGWYRVSANTNGGSLSREMHESASWGWTLLLPFDHAFGGEMPWLTMLWVGGLLLPVGYWAGRSGRLTQASAAGALLVLLVLGLWAIPAGFGLHHGVPTEWFAGLSGSTVGWILGRWSGRERVLAPAPARPDQAATQ